MGQVRPTNTVRGPVLACSVVLAWAGIAHAEAELRYACGGDLGFSVQTFPESGKGHFEGPFAAELVPDGQGAWVNEAQMVQFWPEEAVPTLFISSEQFNCLASEPVPEPAPEPAPEVPTTTADLAMAPYGTARGWEVQSYAQGGAFAGCGGIISQPEGFLILQEKPTGWELRVPAEQNEGFAGGTITLDGKVVDAQFGFTPEGAGEAGLEAGFAHQLGQGNSLVTKINGAAEAHWSLAGAAAAVTLIEECFAREGKLR